MPAPQSRNTTTKTTEAYIALSEQFHATILEQQEKDAEYQQAIQNLQNQNKTTTTNLRIAEQHVQQAYAAIEGLEQKSQKLEKEVEELRRVFKEHKDEIALLQGAIEGILDARIRREREALDERARTGL
ncbi:hypothetical protein AC578_4025 [Pseudocercospora eumusae]|uniref:Uncharacterized protein n=1 Tax=Pseudocercospora eumusae TaxID=321146 RepID=A0A139HDZ3_9PEZI|nr:hypothetical protein AC578_4025 [Pseudocercospora eumusae]